MSLSLDTTCTVEGASLLTYDCHRTVPAPFLTKTYHLVDDPATDDIVSWGEDETTFVVWRPPEFARDLLPNYFKHNNFSSFVRQLNTYGFRKIVPDHWEFANKFFRRGEKQLLCEIHRRKSSQYGSGTTSDLPGSQSTSPTNSGEDQAWSPFPSPLSSPSTILMPQGASTLMSDENERLRHDNRMLLLELSRLRRLYDDLVVILQQQSKVSLQGSDHQLPISPLSRLRTLTDHKQQLSATISEQIEAAARRSEARDHHTSTLRFSTTNNIKDSSSPASGGVRLRPPSVESASCIGLLNRSSHLSRSDSATPKASTLSFLDGKLREMASNSMASNSNPSQQRQLHPDDSNKPSSPAPKLFGVSLNNKSPWAHDHFALQKRPRASSCGPDGEPSKLQLVMSRKLAGDDQGSSEPPGADQSKRTKVIKLGLEPSSTDHHQPWLRISTSSCAERVFM